MSKPRTEREIYRRQGIELAEEGKLTLNVSSTTILEIEDDCVLGKTIREMYKNKVQSLDEYINHMKNLE